MILSHCLILGLFLGYFCHSSICFFIFSERELELYAVARLSVVRLSSVCLSVCMSSVCNARAPYSGGSNFQQYFYGIR